MPLDDENLCELSREELAVIIARLKGEIPTTVQLPDNSHVIPALGNKIIYSQLIPNIFRMKLYIIAWNEVLGKYKSFDIDTSFMGGVAKDSISNRLGNGLNMAISFYSDGTSIELIVNNNEAQDIQLRMKRLDYINA